MSQSQFQIPDRDADPLCAEIESQRRAGMLLTRLFSLLHIAVFADPSARLVIAEVLPLGRMSAAFRHDPLHPTGSKSPPQAIASLLSNVLLPVTQK
jgi:hypothetical protein